MDVQDGAGSKPVFVDPTGRRSRRMQRGIWLLGGLFGCYLALVLVSLVGTPGLSRLTIPGVGPVLPGPAAPQIGSTAGPRRPPARLLPSAVSPSPTAGGTRSPTAGPGAQPTPSVSPTPARSPSPSGPPRATPSSATVPSTAASPARPSPRNTRAPTARPSRGPR